MGRPSRLDDPEFCNQIAQLVAAGKSHPETAEALGLFTSKGEPDTKAIARYKRHPKVKVIVTRLINDRVQEITRKVDSILAGRLSQPDMLTTRELIEIRKEYLNGALRAETEQVDSITVNQAMEAANNPEFMAALEALDAAGA